MAASLSRFSTTQNKLEFRDGQSLLRHGSGAAHGVLPLNIVHGEFDSAGQALARIDHLQPSNGHEAHTIDGVRHVTDRFDDKVVAALGDVDGRVAERRNRGEATDQPGTAFCKRPRSRRPQQRCPVARPVDGVPADVLARTPQAGGIFRLEPGVAGTPVALYKG